MRLVITGTPGTGKTHIAKLLAKKLGMRYVSVKELSKNFRIAYDKQRRCWVIDVKKLSKIKLGDNVLVEGVIAHFLSPKQIDFCIVLRASPRAIRRRLRKRNWTPRKVEENVEAEMLDVCLIESLEMGHKVIEVDTTGKRASEVVKEIIELLKRGKPRYGVVSWMR